MEFEWDFAKAESNLEKHGVSLAEAITVFGDPLKVTIHDRIILQGEFRFLSLGCSSEGRLLLRILNAQGGSVLSGHVTPPQKERRKYESE